MVRTFFFLIGSDLMTLHTFAGLGAFVAPLAATNFATQGRWYFHYLISSGIAISNTAAVAYVFRLKRQDSKSCISLSPFVTKRLSFAS